MTSSRRTSAQPLSLLSPSNIHQIYADTPIGTKVQVYGEY